VEHPAPVVTLSELTATPTTEITNLTGEPVRWSASTGGVRIEAAPEGAEGPLAFRCRQVSATP
jgi:hypothetical protein